MDISKENLFLNGAAWSNPTLCVYIYTYNSVFSVKEVPGTIMMPLFITYDDIDVC